MRVLKLSFQILCPPDSVWPFFSDVHRSNENENRRFVRTSHQDITQLRNWACCSTKCRFHLRQNFQRNFRETLNEIHPTSLSFARYSVTSYNLVYYMAGSTSGQDEANPVF